MRLPEQARPFVDALLVDRSHPGWSDLLQVTRAVARGEGLDEDGAGDVLLRMVGKLPGWQGSTAGELVSWLVTMSRHYAIDARRRRYAHKRGGGWIRVEGPRLDGGRRPMRRELQEPELATYERELVELGGEAGVVADVIAGFGRGESSAGLTLSGEQKRRRRARAKLLAVGVSP